MRADLAPSFHLDRVGSTHHTDSSRSIRLKMWAFGWADRFLRCAPFAFTRIEASEPPRRAVGAPRNGIACVSDTSMQSTSWILTDLDEIT